MSQYLLLVTVFIDPQLSNVARPTNGRPVSRGKTSNHHDIAFLTINSPGFYGDCR